MSLPDAALVRIQTAAGVIKGSGFLFTEEAIVTCAHVVQSALSLKTLPESPPTGKVIIDFFRSSETGIGHVDFWQPEQDIAGLLLSSPCPPGAYPLEIAQDDDLHDRKGLAFGLPKGGSNGVWSEGKFVGKNRSGKWQFNGTDTNDFPFEAGFSGGVIWDRVRQTCLGMIAQYETDPSIDIAYVISGATILAACREWNILKQPDNKPPHVRVLEIVLRERVELWNLSWLKAPTPQQSFSATYLDQNLQQLVNIRRQISDALVGTDAEQFSTYSYQLNLIPVFNQLIVQMQTIEIWLGNTPDYSLGQKCHIIASEIRLLATDGIRLVMGVEQERSFLRRDLTEMLESILVSLNRFEFQLGVLQSQAAL